MKYLTLTLACLLMAAPAQAACDFARLEQRLATPRPAKAAQEIDVLDQQSVDGGRWSIFTGAGGKPNLILRSDFGESGRSEHSLVFQDRGTYIIRHTRFLYSVPYYVSGSSVLREEAVYYRFCDGALVVLPDSGMDRDYMAAARAAAKSFFSAPEISKVLISAGLRPPLWK